MRVLLDEKTGALTVAFVGSDEPTYPVVGPDGVVLQIGLTSGRILGCHIGRARCIGSPSLQDLLKLVSAPADEKPKVCDGFSALKTQRIFSQRQSILALPVCRESAERKLLPFRPPRT